MRSLGVWFALLRQLGASSSGVLCSIGGGAAAGAATGAGLGALGLNPVTIAIGAFFGGLIGAAASYEVCSAGFEELYDFLYDK